MDWYLHLPQLPQIQSVLSGATSTLMNLKDSQIKLILAGTAGTLILYKLLKPQPYNMPPGPRGWPVLGNLLGKYTSRTLPPGPRGWPVLGNLLGKYSSSTLPPGSRVWPVLDNLLGKYTSSTLPPGPRGWPVLGNLLGKYTSSALPPVREGGLS